MFDSKAFDLINRLPPELDQTELVKRILERKRGAGNDRLITEEDVRSLLPKGILEPIGTILPETHEPAGEPEVIFDPTQAISPTDASEGYKGLFRDRYQRLLAIVRSRPDMRGVTGTGEARNLKQGQRAKVAGLLSSRINRRGSMELVLDDPAGTLRVVCQDDVVVKAALELPLDCLVVVDVLRSKAGQAYANSITMPDIADRRPTVASHESFVVLLSDLHVGSKMFLVEDFQRFILWLNGRLGDETLVNKIRYIVVAGDLVDGVGVYPGQELQLGDKEPKHQYHASAQLLEQIPKHIQVIVSPGNHDAVRQALPQPAVSVDLAESLYGLENVRWVGNPAYVRLDGVMFLVYHGRSLDDVIATTPNLSYRRPTDAMRLLLRSRHLAPTYGKRTALAPELRDMLVVDPVPEVFHCGHVHTIDVSSYRGTLLINSGTWQAQTNFQANMGLEPTPSIVPIVNLSTLEVVRRNFGAEGFVNS
jgi:DNA polymerase II small subunit